MKVISVLQKSDEWLAIRAKHRCASEASAAMGCSRFMSRTDLLAQKASGFIAEVDAQTQALFNRGHAAEFLARTIVEDIIGEELYPITATDDAGYLLASFDGITLDEKIGWESKLWNAELVAAVRKNDLPPSYYWQLEHQCLVGNLDHIVFTCTDGTLDNFVTMIYRSIPIRAKALMAGWKQFDEDLANFKHVESVPKPIGKSLMALPTLDVRLSGQVLSSNLAIYRSTALDFIVTIKTDLQTDQDFADAEKAIKFCGDAEKELEAVKVRALSSTVSIDELFRTMDVVRNALRDKRLVVEKLVKARKEAIRIEIGNEGKAVIGAHLIALKQRLGRTLPIMADDVDIVGAMRGKKTVASLRDAVSNEVARFKIAANELADKIDANQKTLVTLAGEFMFLFHDAELLTTIDTEHLNGVVSSRIADYVVAEKCKADKIRANERQRIQDELTLQNQRIEAEVVIPDFALPTIAAEIVRRWNRPSDALDTARLDWIIDHMTVQGGGKGFTLTCFVPVDCEDLRTAIDAAISAKETQ